MTTIKCNKCGEEIEVDKALAGQIEARVLTAEHQKHAAELAEVKKQVNEAVDDKLKQRLELEAEKFKQALELEREKTKIEIEGQSKKQLQQQELLIRQLHEDSKSDKEIATELRGQLMEMIESLREEKKGRADAELAAQKKLAENEDKIREETRKSADESHRLKQLEIEKKLADTQKALDDAQRKAAQGSQQLQGEIMELDFEQALDDAFRDDTIEPIAKGVKGGDIVQTVRGPRGTACGVILWEIKRTKNWADSWIPKLKEDTRNARANIAVIISEAMPRQVTDDTGQLEGVWICKPNLAIILGSLLRKGLLDVGFQKALAANRGGKAEALYNFVTSHEFIQQVEAMIETYQEMAAQVTRERVAYEKLWAQREKQAQKLLLSTANIIGSMQEHVGQASMPKIKGLELLEAGEDG